MLTSKEMRNHKFFFLNFKYFFLFLNLCGTFMIIFSEIAEIMKNVNLRNGADLELLEKQIEGMKEKEQYIITITNFLTGKD